MKNAIRWLMRKRLSIGEMLVAMTLKLSGMFAAPEAVGKSFDEISHRLVNTLSGGEQKKLVLRALLQGPEEVLLLDEPDNYLDVPSKRWLEEVIGETKKTVLFVSHDRELLDRTANKIITLEQGCKWKYCLGAWREILGHGMTREKLGMNALQSYYFGGNKSTNG